MRVALFACNGVILFMGLLTSISLAMEAPPVYSPEKMEFHTRENLELEALPPGFSQYQKIKVWNADTSTETEYTVSNLSFRERWSRHWYRRPKKRLIPIERHDHGILFYLRLKRGPHERFGFGIQSDGENKENRVIRVLDGSSAKDRGLFVGDVIVAVSEDGTRYLDVTGTKARGKPLILYLNSLQSAHTHFIIRRGE